MAEECPFCAIAVGEADQDLIVFRTENVFVIPTLKQRPANPGQVMALPNQHVTALHAAEPALLTELFQVVARITAVAPEAFGGVGTTIFNSNNAPDQVLSHLHVHVVPRFDADNLVIPNPSNKAAPRSLRVELASRLRRAMGG
ncbi:HIT family protein [Nonomuraea sp. NPDC003754]